MSDETRGLSPVAREHLKQCRAELAKARARAEQPDQPSETEETENA